MHSLCDDLSMPSRLTSERAWDERGFEQLFEQTRHSLWRLAIRMTSDAETAADLVQETFMRGLRKGLPEELPAARAWLFRTLVNLCRDRYRYTAVRKADPGRAGEAVAIGAPSDPERNVLVAEAVRNALATLSPRGRALLLLHELEGESVEALAATFGVRPMTVRWHLAKAKKEVRHHLEAAREEGANDV
jgi:RNA polymerase sigma-70 factor (ECF subfamily)